jgi:large-conductance mechanosensitive channel
MSMLAEFKEFAMKGNVVDMAVAPAAPPAPSAQEVLLTEIRDAIRARQ